MEHHILDIKNIESDWRDYKLAKETGIKPKCKAILAEKLHMMEELSQNDASEYLMAMCSAYFDHKQEWIPIQHPDIWNKILSLWTLQAASPSAKLLIWSYKAFLFRKVCHIFKLEPYELLNLALAIEPHNQEAKELLFTDHLNTLDFAMHHFPDHLIGDIPGCNNLIEICEKMLSTSPELNDCKPRLKYDFKYYRALFFAWIEYTKLETRPPFLPWLKSKLLF